MKKQETLKKVLEFMSEVKTENLTSNEFIWGYAGYTYNQHNDIMVGCNFRSMPSVESILRSRRKIIADHGFAKRTKADKEADYIKEYARSDRYKM